MVVRGMSKPPGRTHVTGLQVCDGSCHIVTPWRFGPLGDPDRLESGSHRYACQRGFTLRRGVAPMVWRLSATPCRYGTKPGPGGPATSPIWPQVHGVHLGATSPRDRPPNVTGSGTELVIRGQSTSSRASELQTAPKVRPMHLCQVLRRPARWPGTARRRSVVG